MHREVETFATLSKGGHPDVLKQISRRCTEASAWTEAWEVASGQISELFPEVLQLSECLEMGVNRGEQGKGKGQHLAGK